MGVPNREDLVEIYRKRAKNYDSTAGRFELFGYREGLYRKRAVEALGLEPGDTVVEIGCGTGLNLPLLQECIGHEGKIIGVEMTDAMLEMAKQRVADEEWANVELVHIDAASFRFPSGIDGILSTFVITLVPEFDAVIRDGFEALKPGKRLAILDYKVPSNWLSLSKPLLPLFLRPFGYNANALKRKPWKSIDKYMKNTSLIEFFGGFVYIASGERSEEALEAELEGSA